MTKELIKTGDLGSGWLANLWSDGSLTLRNFEKGQRIDVPRDSADRLRAIFAETQYGDRFAHTAGPAEAEALERDLEA